MASQSGQDEAAAAAAAVVEAEALQSTTQVTAQQAAAPAPATATAIYSTPPPPLPLPLPTSLPPPPPSPAPAAPTNTASFPSKSIWHRIGSTIARFFAVLTASFWALVHRLRNILTASSPRTPSATDSSTAEQSASESAQQHLCHHHEIEKSAQDPLLNQQQYPSSEIPDDDMTRPRGGGGRKKENAALTQQKGKQQQQQPQQQQRQRSQQQSPQKQQSQQPQQPPPQHQNHQHGAPQQQKPQQQKPQQYQNQYQQQQKPQSQQASSQQTFYQQKPKQPEPTPETGVKTIANGVKSLHLGNGFSSNNSGGSSNINNSNGSNSNNTDAVSAASPAAVKPSYSAALRSVNQSPQPSPRVPTPPADPPVKLSPAEEAAKEAEKMVHRGYMNDALEMARLALRTNETPVGCVLVYKGRIIAKGMNATNVTRNGTRHAELMALTALLSYSDAADTEDPGDKVHTEQEWGDVDPRDGHIYPYGQKLHPSPRVNKDVIHECVLYVTVEPCVMCASLLRQLGIKKVYFGAVNDKFGGTGGVFRIHKNSNKVDDDEPPSRPRQLMAPARLTRSQKASANAAIAAAAAAAAESGSDSGSITENKPPSTIPIAEGTVPEASEGDGGNVEPGYDVEGGWGRDDAVTLLRQFYVQENGRAPVPRKKEGRAARLAAMMEKGGQSSEGGANLASATNESSSATPNTKPATTPIEDMRENNMPSLAPPLVALPQVNVAAAAAAAAAVAPRSVNGTSSAATVASVTAAAAAAAAGVSSSSDERKA